MTNYLTQNRKKLGLSIPSRIFKGVHGNVRFNKADLWTNVKEEIIVKDGKKAANIYLWRESDEDLLKDTFRTGYVYRLLLYSISAFEICLQRITNSSHFTPMYVQYISLDFLLLSSG